MNCHFLFSCTVFCSLRVSPANKLCLCKLGDFYPLGMEKVLIRKILRLRRNFLEVDFWTRKRVCCMGQQMATSTCCASPQELNFDTCCCQTKQDYHLKTHANTYWLVPRLKLTEECLILSCISSYLWLAPFFGPKSVQKTRNYIFLSQSHWCLVCMAKNWPLPEGVPSEASPVFSRDIDK